MVSNDYEKTQVLPGNAFAKTQPLETLEGRLGSGTGGQGTTEEIPYQGIAENGFENLILRLVSYAHGSQEDPVKLKQDLAATVLKSGLLNKLGLKHNENIPLYELNTTLAPGKVKKILDGQLLEPKIAAYVANQVGGQAFYRLIDMQSEERANPKAPVAPFTMERSLIKLFLPAVYEEFTKSYKPSG